jgi:ribonuclease BN (tRNA processing enzyme)
MSIRVLGCSGSIAAGSRTTSFLLDTSVLIDAGTGVGDLTLAEMVAIDHILVTHSHLDHVLSIGLLADSTARRRRAAGKGPIVVHALPATIAALKLHIFNGVIWPDFTCLPDVEHPLIAFEPLAVGERLELAGRTIEVLSAAHTVPAVGYAVMATRADRGAWVFTGDTGPNPALWQRLAALPVASLVIETAFSDEEKTIAQVSGHLCPSELRAELQRLRQPTDVYITHIKPGEVERVMTEIAGLGSEHRVHALTTGQVIALE